VGQGRCHGIGAGTLVLEGEGPDNQHEVEGGRGEGGGGSVKEGAGVVVVVRGGGCIITISNNFFKHYYFLDKIINLQRNILGDQRWRQFLVVPNWYGGPKGDTFRIFH
jgi:hypothetical protein